MINKQSINMIEHQNDVVTTIIPVFNRPDMLVEAVESVLSQSYRPIEVIIVDDGSTDETVEVADDLFEKHPDEIRVIHQRNTGPGLAREAGRQISRGEFIQYLDSDDILLPRKFEVQVTGLKTSPDFDVAYGKTRYRHTDGTVEPGHWKESGIRREQMFPSFLVSRWWDTPTPLYRRAICDKAGSWTGLRLEEDWEYDCRVASLGGRLYYCDAFVAEVRDHSGRRLCRGGALRPERLVERATAHKLIFKHALNAGINYEVREMQHFSRALFLLSRQSGAAGLTEEARDLFYLAKKASGPDRSRGLDFRIYRIMAKLIGWKITGYLSCLMDKCRN